MCRRGLFQNEEQHNNNYNFQKEREKVAAAASDAINDISWKRKRL